MINIDELRKIIADAPTFTHEINPDGTYRAGAINGDIRSLADIKTIIEQADTITSLRVMVKNLGAKAICKDGVEELTHELNNANRIIAEQADRITELEVNLADVLVAFTQDVYESGELSFSDGNWLCSFAAEWKQDQAGDL